MCVSTFSALHMNLNNLISSSFGGFGDQWQLPILAVEGGSAGVGRSRQAGDSWCDHTGSARNIHLLTEGNVDVAFLLPFVLGNNFAEVFPRQDLSLSFCLDHFTLRHPFFSGKP